MLTIIGDVHGHANRHADIMGESDYTLQIGDLGFDYAYLKNWDSAYHKCILGNHDNYDIAGNLPHNLGDWGVRVFGGTTFYIVRGAFSIDREERLMHEHRTGRKSWWENEELNERQIQLCLNDYAEATPNIVITHAVPKDLADKIGNPSVLRYFGFNPSSFNTRTQQLLQDMLNIHEPDLWIHGHLHISHRTQIGHTTFIGLKELETFIIE